MNSEFNNYEEEYQQQQKKLIGKFHTAPHHSEQDYRETMEEFNLFKMAYEGMQLSNAEKARQYRSDFMEVKQQFNRYIQQCSPTLAMAIKQNEDLAEYTRQAYEAEGNAVKIQFELRNQTNKLENMVGKVKMTQQEIRDSEGLINRLKSRACMMRILSYSMITLLLIGVIVIFWYKFS